MKTIEIKKANGSLAQYAKNVKRTPIFLVESGRPVAALISTEDLDWETISLSMNPKFMHIIEHSRKSYKKKGGLSTEEMRLKLSEHHK